MACLEAHQTLESIALVSDDPHELAHVLILVLRRCSWLLHHHCLVLPSQRCGEECTGLFRGPNSQAEGPVPCDAALGIAASKPHPKGHRWPSGILRSGHTDMNCWRGPVNHDGRRGCIDAADGGRARSHGVVIADFARSEVGTDLCSGVHVKPCGTVQCHKLLDEHVRRWRLERCRGWRPRG